MSEQPGNGAGASEEVGDANLEQAILDLLSRRAPSSTICPSDVARALGGENWRRLMEPTRAAAGRLVAAGRVEITQHGEAVDLDTVTGPIRIRRAGKFTDGGVAG